MRLIPVLDIRQGQTVHARGGDRAHYEPLQSVLHPGSDPIVLARAGFELWGLTDLYLADLDAIQRQADPNFGLYQQLVRLGLSVWVDPGIKTSEDVPRLIDAGIDHWIVGLETIGGLDDLAAITSRFGADRLVFSLDLKQGQPMVETLETWGTSEVSELVRRAIDAGVRRMIRLELDRVGTGRGLGLKEMLNSQVEWFLGGGIRDFDEVRQAHEAGLSGLLIGSALHHGRIGAKDLDVPWISHRRTSSPIV